MNTTTNYLIMKAMITAAAEECDVINLSLGGGPEDTVVEEAIRDARGNGMLVVVAAGNDYRKPVSYPAKYPGAMAVSALGVVGCFPPRSSCQGSVVQSPPPSVNPNEFIASFSNFGSHIAVTAPGVGIISTLRNHDYGVLSGTSQAAPVIAGAAACLLSQNRHIYRLLNPCSRNQAPSRSRVPGAPWRTARTRRARSRRRFPVGKSARLRGKRSVRPHDRKIMVWKTQALCATLRLK